MWGIMAHLLLSPQVTPVSQSQSAHGCSCSQGIYLGASEPVCVFISWCVSAML